MLVGEHRGDFNETAADGSAMRHSGSGRAPNPHASLLFRGGHRFRLLVSGAPLNRKAYILASESCLILLDIGVRGSMPTLNPEPSVVSLAVIHAVGRRALDKKTQPRTFGA